MRAWSGKEGVIKSKGCHVSSCVGRQRGAQVNHAGEGILTEVLLPFLPVTFKSDPS